MPPKRKNDLFVNVTNADIERRVSNKKQRVKNKAVPVSSQTPVLLPSAIYWQQLTTSPSQTAELEKIYQNTANISDVNFTADDSSQQAAAALIQDLRLSPQARESLGNKWVVAWWTQPSEKLQRSTKRVLYQCTCGYDHTSKKAEAQRACPFPYTACLAHVEVTYSPDEARVFRVRGYMNHNANCETATIERKPNVPLHPSVVEEAVKQRLLGATITDIMDRNQELLAARAYAEQPPLTELAQSPFRWVLLQTDMKTVYRKEALQRGVDTRTKAQYNIDEWLDPTSPKFNRAFSEALFHYQERADRGERFEACVATEEMKSAAWEYCHTKQLILDGTFGVCDRKILLFIAMGVDADRHGIPVAFFFFSAPSGNQQTSAGYDTEVLTRLLAKWKTSLGAHRPGQEFKPAVAITDTDLRERAALLNVWPKILLIICKFHLRQSWRNYRNKHLKGKSPTIKVLRDRICTLEAALVETTAWIEATNLLEDERRYLSRVTDASAVAKATTVLDYLESYWIKDGLWHSWSKFARVNAARVLKCDVLEVLPTTNHLESFNGILKRKHLRKYQHGSKRLRLDVLLLLLITDIIPNIFQRRRFIRIQQAAVDAQLASVPGGRELLEARNARARSPNVVAFLAPDPARDSAAAGLVQRLHHITNTPTGVEMACYSSSATEANPTSYSIRVGFDSTASCSCPDFTQRGGACKHLRAALRAIELYRTGQSGHAPVAIPPTPLPPSERAARALELQRGIAQAQRTPMPMPTPTPTRPLEEVLPAALFEAACSEDSDSATGADDDDDLASVSTDDGSVEHHEFVEPTAADGAASLSVVAIQAQTCARVARNLQAMAPRIGDINEWLGNIDQFTADELPVVQNAIGQFEALLAHLRRWTDRDGTSVHRHPAPAPRSLSGSSPRTATVSNDPRSDPAPSVSATAQGAEPLPARRQRKQLLLPSPERRQTRTKSYGVD